MVRLAGTSRNLPLTPRVLSLPVLLCPRRLPVRSGCMRLFQLIGRQKVPYLARKPWTMGSPSETAPRKGSDCFCRHSASLVTLVGSCGEEGAVVQKGFGVNLRRQSFHASSRPSVRSLELCSLEPANHHLPVTRPSTEIVLGTVNPPISL